jgi:lysophospholipid acyltransferase (LPLAT)-like uncharacterized protein
VVDTPLKTKSKRRLTPARMFVYRIAVWVASLVLEVVWRTSRMTVLGEDRLAALIREQGSVVPVFWHQHLLVGGRFIVSNRNGGLRPGFMVSPSVDGQAPTMLAHFYGAQVVRGSGSYTGVRALRGVHQAIAKDEISPAITPDGPRGPRFKLKPGAIFAAQISRKAVVPIAYAARPRWMLKTWDKFIIPAPFARIVIAIGEPYFPPRRLDDAEMEAAQREVERRLHETFKQAAAELKKK